MTNPSSVVGLEDGNSIVSPSSFGLVTLSRAVILAWIKVIVYAK